MRLILSLTGGGLSDPAPTRTVSEGSLTIGRGASNAWVLPDPQQLMSRTHCAVSIEGSRAILTDLSSNGVFVNGARQPTERDMRIVLTDGDFLAFGEYTFKVAIIDDGVGGAAQGIGSFPGAALPNPPSLSFGGRDASNPLDVDPLADPLGRPTEVPDPFAIARNPGFSHPIAHVAVNPRGTPDPFDTEPHRGSGFDDRDLFRGTTPSSDWTGLPQADHARATSAAMPAQRVVNPMSMDDFDKLLGGLDVPPPAAPADGFAPPTHTGHPEPVHVSPMAPGMLHISLDDLLGTAPVVQSSARLLPQAPPPVAAPVAEPDRHIDDPRGGGRTSGAAEHLGTSQVHDPFEVPAHPGDGFHALVAPPGGQPPPMAGVDVAQPVRPTAQGMSPHPGPDVYFTGNPPLVDRSGTASSANPFDDPEPVPRIPPSIVTSGPAPTPEIAPSQRASAPVAAPVVVPAPSSAADDLLAAFASFLEGAGLSAAQVDSSNPAGALHAAGAVFRAMAEGLREVLISRTEIKSEMRVERTMISAHGNNALKFSVTPDEAVIALLTPKRPGYMPPLAATKEAFNDIKEHELAVMAGVQTALMDLLKRFEPDVLEKRLSPSALGSILPATRKARYWDGFQDAYKQISREAEDDFQSIFGRSFAKAYTAQIRKE